MKAYDNFISTKLRRAASIGLDPAEWMRTRHLFDFQEAIAGWGLRKGRAAIFADTGLGKTRMQLAWADAINRATGNAVLILAPLAVAEQTVSEGRAMGVDITHARDGSDCSPGINITNYDRLHRFDPSLFNAVVLDESSIIKHHDAKTLGVLMDAFRDARFKLCATATPAPNDWTELGTHAEFLGICSRSEMLSEFFVHDGGETQVWRLKGHAKAEFWKWVSSWGAMIRSPSDLGMDSKRYDLPALNVRQIVVESDAKPMDGELFTRQAQTLSERRKARRDSMRHRIDACIRLIKGKNAMIRPEHAEGQDNAVEARVQRKQAKKGSEESGATRKKDSFSEGVSGKEQGCEKGISRQVLHGKSGEVQKKQGGECKEERSEAQKIRTGRGIQREGEVASQAKHHEKPRIEKEWTAEVGVRDRRDGSRGFDGDTGREMRDLRVLGHVEYEDVSCCGSLPYNGSDKRDSLLKLQPGAGEVQGQPEAVVCCDSIPFEKFIIWCELNAEQDALEKACKNEGITCASVRGATPREKKVSLERAWRDPSGPQVFISKPSVFGWGMNWQHCRNVAFVGVTDSWEAYYQAVRRCWRFGQTREVNVSLFVSEQEGAVRANLERKEIAAKAMLDSLSEETRKAVQTEILGQALVTNTYVPKAKAIIPDWLRSVA